MRTLLPIILFLSSAVPLHAELTLSEKAEVKELFLASIDTAEAIDDLTEGAQETTLQNRPAIGNASYWLLQGQRALDEAMGLLLWIDIDQNAPWDISTTPRADFLTGAWAKLDRARDVLSWALPELDAAANATTDPTRKADFLRAKQEAQNAQAFINGFDRELGYLDPRPLDYPQVIGPHSDYDRQQAATFQGILFLSDSQSHFRAWHLSDPLWPNYIWYRRVGLRSLEAGRKIRESLLRAAIIPTSEADCAMNPFHLVAFSTLPMLSHESESGFDGVAGIPYHNNQLLDDSFAEMVDRIIAVAQTSPSTVPENRDAMVNAIRRWNLWWRFTDGGMKVLMEFPDPSKLDGVGDTANPRGPFGPPLCPQ